MSLASSVLALVVGSVLASAPPDQVLRTVPLAPATLSTGAEPAAPEAGAEGPAPAPAANDEYVEDPPSGLPLLITGPILIAIGIPLSFAGNAAWRNACGPTTTDRECARGSAGSALAHTATGLAFGGGMALTAAGGARYGKFSAFEHVMEGKRTHKRSGMIVAGAVLLPVSLLSLGLVRLFFWLPTPECKDAGCVAQFQTTSTLAVSGLALVGGLGAGLMMYGIGYNSGLRRYKKSVAIVPQAGRGYAGLSLTGRF